MQQNIVHVLEEGKHDIVTACRKYPKKSRISLLHIYVLLQNSFIIDIYTTLLYYYYSVSIVYVI